MKWEYVRCVTQGKLEVKKVNVVEIVEHLL